MSGEQGMGFLGPLDLIKLGILREHKAQLSCVQMSKQRLREAGALVQGHTAGGGRAGVWPGWPALLLLPWPALRSP